MTPALVLFRLKGLYRDAQGNGRCANHVLAKVSRLEVAEAFMSPPSQHLVNALLQAGTVTTQEADMARHIPMSYDVCVEADSGGHTDCGIPTVLLPAMLEMERAKLERSFFKRCLSKVWEETLHYLSSRGREKDKEIAQANPKVRMARVLRWYFAYSTELAFSGSTEDRVNYQVHTGPALGAFNQWVKGTALEPWTQRHVDEIAIALMKATAEHLRSIYERFPLRGLG